MPWKCIPCGPATDALRQTLARTYQVQGIPHLVILNAEDGKIVTTSGVEDLMGDAQGERFPWAPPSLAEIWPSHILTTTAANNNKKKLVEASQILDPSKYILLYFSAHWCPPCRAFTPKLGQAYQQLKASPELADQVELVFVSSDQDQVAFDEYFNDMPFCALPFAERRAKEQLSKRFGIEGLPTLLTLGPVVGDQGDRPVINDKVRSFIMAGEALTDFPYHPKSCQDLTMGVDGIHEHKSLIVFCEQQDDEEQATITSIVTEVAQAFRQAGHDTQFFTATAVGGIGSAIRQNVGLPAQPTDANMILVMVDIPDNGGYYVKTFSDDADDLTAEVVRAFLDNPGPRQKMGESEEG
uniref:Thioredoxin domain-containing protein n=1 Tax=Amphora coffeiformis TaxID=265554 RepID=A0A7S3P094_9STRA